MALGDGERRLSAVRVWATLPALAGAALGVVLVATRPPDAPQALESGDPESVTSVSGSLRGDDPSEVSAVAEREAPAGTAAAPIQRDGSSAPSPGSEPRPKPKPASTRKLRRLRKWLLGRDRFNRAAAFKALGKDLDLARQLLPELERLAAWRNKVVQPRAMLLYMQATESRKYVREMAWAASTVPTEHYAHYLRRIDPLRADRMIEASRSARISRALSREPHPAIVKLLDAWVAGEPAPEGLLERELRDSTPRGFRWWLRIVVKMRPLPASVADALVSRVDTGVPYIHAVIHNAFEAIAEDDNETLAMRRRVVAALRRRLLVGDPNEQCNAARALFRLEDRSTDAFRVSVQLTKTRSGAGTVAIRALAALAEDARPAVAGLLRAADEVWPERRGEIVLALLAAKDARATGLLTNQLQHGTAFERRSILTRMAEQLVTEDFREAVVRATAHNDPEVAADAVRCMARVMGDLPTAEAEGAFVAALQRGSSVVRLAALSSIPKLQRLPGEVGPALRAAVAAHDSKVRAAAIKALWSCHQLGRAGEPIAPTLHAMAATSLSETAGADDVSAKAAALRALGRVAPDRPGVRELLRRSTTRHPRPVVRAAVRAMCDLQDPTPQDAWTLWCRRMNERDGLHVLVHPRFQSEVWKAAREAGRPESAKFRRR